jgi:hypothetical protein
MPIRSRVACLIFLSVAVVHPSFAASDQALEKRFVDALRHDGKGHRQERAGQAIRAYKSAGVLAFKPQRMDYNDYYVVRKPASFLGNALVVVMEQYMAQYVGCCVDPGAGAYVRVTASLAPMRAFARANRCRIEEYPDEKAFLREVPVKLKVGPGKYAALRCHESDEAEGA